VYSGCAYLDLRGIFTGRDTLVFTFAFIYHADEERRDLVALKRRAAPEPESSPDYFQSPLLLGIPEDHWESRLTGTEGTRVRARPGLREYVCIAMQFHKDAIFSARASTREDLDGET